MKRSSSSRRRPGARSGRTAEISTAHLERLIREAVVDCYNQSEAMAGFVTMIEDNLGTPFVTNVLGLEVVVDGVELTREESIVALCRRGRSRQAIPILQLPIPKPPPRGAEWIEAYRRWGGSLVGRGPEPDALTTAFDSRPDAIIDILGDAMDITSCRR